jgi:hypothetical protein
MTDKRVDKVLKLAGKIKGQGKSVGVILVNSHANAQRERDAVERMTSLGFGIGLDRDDIFFTSTLGAEYELGIPRSVVRDLFEYSNLFIFPTISECCSLVLLEAMYGGNLLVLNDDLPSLKEFAGFECPLYMRFGSVFQQTTYADEDKYFEDYAKIIVRQLTTANIEKSRQRAALFSPQEIYNSQMERLL